MCNEIIIKDIRTKNLYFRLFVEELKQHHPGYANASVNDRERIKEVNFQFFI